MILKDSRPKITHNNITDNDGIGLYVRDKSHGIIKQNTVSILVEYNINFDIYFIIIFQIKSNEIELVVEKKNPQLQNIHKDNQVTGDIRIPQNFECNIFQFKQAPFKNLHQFRFI